MTVNISVGATLDAAALNQQLADLTRRINQTGEAIAKAGRQQFNPIPRATVEMAQRIEQTMQRINRLSPDLASRLKATGQQGAQFDAIDWSRIYPNPTQAHRARQGLFQMATGLHFMAPPAAPLPGAGGGAGGGGGGVPPPRPGPAAPAPSGGRGWNAAQRILNAGGMPGQAAATGLGAGRAAMAGGAGIMGGIASGIGAGLGFAAFSAVQNLVAAARAQIGAAEQESIGFAGLYDRLGGRASGTPFNSLRRRIRYASDDARIGYDEALELAGTFARRGNLTNGTDLAENLAQSAGFARSFGADPATGVSAFAGMRGVGITRGVDDARRLGLVIAEGIARAGVFAKAEDFLADIAGYGEATARATLSRTNVEGYAEALTGLLRLGLPGLDVQGASAILSRADGAVRGGGAAGEASQAMFFQALGRRHGTGPLETMMLQQGGLFATGANSFGPDTALGRYYAAAGVQLPASLTGGNVTNLEAITGHLRNRYTDPSLLLDATANTLGLNHRQAAGLLSMTPETLRGMQGMLSDDQMRSLSATGVQRMGRIAAGNRGDLDAIATELAGITGRDALTPAEQARLTAARAGDDGTLRAVLAELAATRDQEETEGHRTRRTIQDVEKAIRDLATYMVDPLNTIRDATLAAAGLTRRSAADRVRNLELREIDESERQALAAHDAAQPRRAPLVNELARAEARLAANPDDPGLIAAVEAARQAIDRPDAQRAAIQAEHAARRAAAQAQYQQTITAPEQARRAAAAAEGGRGVGATARQRANDFAAALEAAGGGEIDRNMALGFAANAIGESDVNPGAIGDQGRSAGILQWNGARRSNFQAMFGIDVAQATMEQQAQFAAWELTGRVPPGVDPAVAGRLPRTEAGTLRAMRRRVATMPGGATPGNWAEAVARDYERPLHPDREAPIRRGYADHLAMTPLPPGAPGTVVRDAAGNPVGAGAMRVEVQGTLRVENNRGEAVAPPVPLVAAPGPPRPAGAPR